MRAQRPIRIGNCSGFYGDRASAMADMARAGGIDVLTGDYLAEVTMLILGKARAKDRTKGAMKEAEGKVREHAADLADDESEQLKGFGQQIKGKTQQGLGKAKQALDPNPGRDDV